MTTSHEDLLMSFIGRSHPSSEQAQNVGIPALDTIKLWQVNRYCVPLKFRAPDMEFQTILFSSVS